ncbi:MAG: hypothetical protein JXL97_17455 [Bacteroidales bacterium]|nr:hypothetical protein [Bacteroidales bacterium]
MKFFEIFKNKHVVLPVIHVKNEELTFKNANTAFEEGADGVFLINHHYNFKHLLNIYQKLRQEFKNQWIGINCLDGDALDSFSIIPNDANGLWVDDAEIDEEKENQIYAKKVLNYFKQINWNGLYFGGVAFKYQRFVEDLDSAVKIAKNFMDVITTSGQGTGIAADIQKIKTMRNAAGDFPIAIASGITPENISHYLPYANCFLVSTGISKNFEELDKNKTHELIQNIRSFSIS